MNSEFVSNIISFVSAIASVFATVFAAVELSRSRKANEKREARERKEATINAYNVLQSQVLDNLVSIRPQEVRDVIENIDCKEYRNIYDDYKALIARCEHFAVGVNEGIYDFDVLYALSGEHLIFLYKKVHPVIMQARENCSNSVPFQGFEKLVQRLERKNKMATTENKE